MTVLTPYFTGLPIYILPVIIFLASVVLGWILERTVMYQLMKLTQRTAWAGDDIIIRSLKGMVLVTFIVLGVYLAITTFHISSGLMNLLHKVFSSVLIFMVTIIAARITVGFVTQSAGTVDRIFPASSILRNIIRITVFSVGALIILNTLNVSITPILTALGVGGLAVALALQPTLSNLFSGIQIIASKQLMPGHYVGLSSGEEGYVEDITWRHTSIRTLTNIHHIIPNSKISEAIVTNYYKPSKDTGLIIPLSIRYGSDLEKVEKCCIEVGSRILKSTPGGKKDFTPYVRFGKFDETGVALSVILRTDEINDRYPVTHEFIKALSKAFIEQGIEISYPTRIVLKNS